MDCAPFLSFALLGMVLRLYLLRTPYLLAEIEPVAGVGWQQALESVTTMQIALKSDVLGGLLSQSTKKHMELKSLCG
jgi:hypothetical protein